MKKILFLTPTLPYPPVSGGVIKSNKVVQFLAQKYCVSVACFLKNEDVHYVEEFQSKFTLSTFIYEELNVARNVKNLILSNLQGIPLNLYRNKSTHFYEKIQAIIHQYDVVFCDHYVMFQYIPKSYKQKIILHEHNCEYLIWKRYADIEKNKLKKLALLNQAYRIKNYEREICERANIVLAAPNDRDELVKIGADKHKFIETYHLGDDQLLDFPDLDFKQTELALLYIGTLSWEANIDGLCWFYKDIWQRIKQKYPSIKLYIVGKHPDKRILEMAEKDAQIIVTGFVENVEPYFQKSRVFITPLRFGSGIKVKVVNALYRGIPCVTTSIGTEGLATIDGIHIFSKDTVSDSVDAIDILLKDEEKWKSISKASRAIAREKYAWKAVLDNIETAIEI